VNAPSAAETSQLLPQLLQHLPAAEQAEKLQWLQAALAPLPPHVGLATAAALLPGDDSRSGGSGDRDSARNFLSGLRVARTASDTPPRAVVWVHPAPGQTAIVSAPVAVDSSSGLTLRPTEPVDRLWQTRLLEQAAGWAEKAGVEMLQAVAEPADEAFHRALTEAGIPKLVDLVFLASPPLLTADTRESDVDTQPPVDPGRTAAPLQFLGVPPEGERLQRWYRLLEATYEGSLDCPAINGRRSLPQTVAGYQATGQRWDPGWVMLTSAPAFDLGGFILADHPANDFLELIYFGVVPQARGCGLGRKILQQALTVAAQAGRSRLIAAVDRQNLPALRVYAAADFTALEQRAVFARFFALKSPGLDTPSKIR